MQFATCAYTSFSLFKWFNLHKQPMVVVISYYWGENRGLEKLSDFPVVTQLPMAALGLERKEETIFNLQWGRRGARFQLCCPRLLHLANSKTVCIWLDHCRSTQSSYGYHHILLLFTWLRSTLQNPRTYAFISTWLWGTSLGGLRLHSPNIGFDLWSCN